MGGRGSIPGHWGINPGHCRRVGSTSRHSGERHCGVKGIIPGHWEGGGGEYILGTVVGGEGKGLSPCTVVVENTSGDFSLLR